jgi:hypothetical protein
MNYPFAPMSETSAQANDLPGEERSRIEVANKE